ncbi:MAG: hypothetical protein KatS3mg106_157 [Gemmataceae bacterium]|nr:MAG: hypothetical protein KatS3mg106_157 [Gemmataceae bacterium]
MPKLRKATLEPLSVRQAKKFEAIARGAWRNDHIERWRNVTSRGRLHRNSRLRVSLGRANVLLSQRPPLSVNRTYRDDDQPLGIEIFSRHSLNVCWGHLSYLPAEGVRIILAKIVAFDG